MIITTIMFYVFALFTVGSALAVITVKNPVHAVLLLIFTFFNAAGLFVLLGAELIAMLLIIVYVGAVAVLFLFVVMMLNIRIASKKEGILKYLPLGLIVASVLFVELFLVLYAAGSNIDIASVSPHELPQPIPSNAHALGEVLYTEFVLLFQLSGLVLLVAMIGAIVLTHRKREGVRKQIITDQLARSSQDGVEMVKVEVGRGVE